MSSGRLARQWLEKIGSIRATQTSCCIPQSFDLRVSRKTVQQEVVEKLRHAILSGMFMPGNRLVETDLCTSLGVSRPSLREALRSLQAERLIEIVPNRGPQIPVLSWRDAEEIYEVRELLEVEAAARCAVNYLPEALETLADRLEAFRRAARANDAADQITTASEFYAIILRNCGNKIIEQVQGGLLARVNFLRARSMSLPGRAKTKLRGNERGLYRDQESRSKDRRASWPPARHQRARRGQKGFDKPPMKPT